MYMYMRTWYLYIISYHIHVYISGCVYVYIGGMKRKGRPELYYNLLISVHVIIYYIYTIHIFYFNFETTNTFFHSFPISIIVRVILTLHSSLLHSSSLQSIIINPYNHYYRHCDYMYRDVFVFVFIFVFVNVSIYA